MKREAASPIPTVLLSLISSLFYAKIKGENALYPYRTFPNKGTSQRIIVDGKLTKSRKKEFFREKKRFGALALFLVGAYSAGVRLPAIHACHGRIFAWKLLTILCSSLPYR